MCSLIKLTLIVYLSVAKVHSGAVRDSKLINIAQGPVRGYRHPDHDIFEFFGIPYATAPANEQRFTAPLPPRNWTTTLDAIDRSIACPQLYGYPAYTQKTVQEDCLIANIQVPNTDEMNLPVLVIVHGGGFHLTSGDFLLPSRLAATKKVVTVTFNYRLGAHGFLCLGTKDAPGNAGMKDQVALLRWVRDNIADFGGNPEDVTISGYSAGSAAVDLLMISKAAQGLFNKVIPESGGNSAFWSVNPDPVRYAQEYAQLLNFTNVQDINALEEFYKTVSYDDLNSMMYTMRYDSVLYFSPCIENDLGDERFLDDSPVNIIRSGQYKKVPMLYGFTDMEGLLQLSYYDDWVGRMNERFSDFLPGDLEFQSEDEKETVAQSVREFYFGNNRIGIYNLFNYINYFGDVIFGYPMLRSAKMLIETGHDSIYLYHYTFYKRYPSIPGVPDAQVNGVGADHAVQSDAVYDNIFAVPEEFYTEEYRQLRTIMVELWINFITTEHPVPTDSLLPAWPPTSANLTTHMHLGDVVELRDSPIIGDRGQFWDDIYDRYYRHPIPPYSLNNASSAYSCFALIYLVVAATFVLFL